MPLCTADCADYSLITMPASPCNPQIRERNLSKIGFYLCSTAIPSPLTCSTLQPLIDDGSVVFTSPLRKVSWDAPTFDSIVISDCLPATQLFAGRKLTAEDAVGIQIKDSSGTVTNPYGEYPVYQKIQQAGTNIRCMLYYCDGTIEIPQDSKGNPLPVNVTIYRTFEQEGNADLPIFMELKTIEVTFLGDPLPFNSPALDTSTCAGMII